MSSTCTIKQIPAHQAHEAALRAVQINPANAPALHVPGLAPLAALLPPERLALLTAKYWGAKGVRLTVGFLDSPTVSLRSRLLLHMNAWGTRANVVFSETAGQAQVRIARKAGGGYWSYLGTDILSIPAGQPTMNLEGFADTTRDSEFYRVVRHETGHTLGFPHEHERAEIIALLDPAKTIAYFLANDGWSAAETTQQVLTPLAPGEITATPTADTRSIMCYGLPGSITKSGQPVPGGTDIDENDYQLAAKLYPQADGPPPVQPPPPPPPAGGKLFSLTFGRAVPKGGRVQFAAPVAVPAGAYDFIPSAK